MASLPTFDELPEVPDLPKGCTWGLWNQGDQKDEFGTLNLLTAEVVLSAVNEVRDGISISLNLPLNVPSIPVFNRRPFQHTIIDNSTFSPSKSYDDTISINTQSGSQWDGLRHVVHHASEKLYNGIQKDEIAGSEPKDTLGIDKWHQRGGIVGRGVLLDYVAYSERHGIAASPVERHEIQLHDLKQAAMEQGVSFKQGDILCIRSGLIKWYHENPHQREAYFQDPAKKCIGVAANTEILAWIWNEHFAAVAGDAIAWETVPYPSEQPSLHQSLIPMFGMPIGELWDLEALATTCARLNRYTFLLTSVPLRIPGGVASPPNAAAIF
ncbi:hypothetical protein PENARI_c005G11722 [Penicillium arizonense]|uniref:Cyclase n=1 Tax=Penicillium arizonense TaxID=1835702 RepID=A0A1F5LNR1_PENAI|nr:hypothetical protein PENARI_c005G11722 [Penicillium arizonense]OGE54765.1 hypothetical protein PENARI_c005G11722 [Penicillium arizonense]